MKISLIVEGESEKIFLDAIRNFLKPRCLGPIPKLNPVILNCDVPPRHELLKIVRALLLDQGNRVIILTDVKGQNSFNDAQDAIAQIESRLSGLPELNVQVFVHAAQYELEAWLIPFWPQIQKLAHSKRPKPSTPPERINNLKPPSKLLSEVWRTGNGNNKKYSKVLDLRRILNGQDLEHASKECPTLKSFLNRLLTLSGAPTL